MIDELNVQAEFHSYWQQQAGLAVANFRRKRLHAEYVPDRRAALEKVLSLIPPGASVGWGNSVTLRQIGVISALKESGDHQVFDSFVVDEDGNSLLSGEERLNLQRQALLADVFLSGANAITLDGKVVATDANGNRVAAMIFGPKKVIIVAGINKLVPDLDAALDRIHRVASPVNFRRLASKYHRTAYYELPCVKTGKCVDCTHPERGCCYTIIIEAGRSASPQFPLEHVNRVNIVLVGESLGI